MVEQLSGQRQSGGVRSAVLFRVFGQLSRPRVISTVVI